MLLEIATAALVGAALGLKFQAFILIPASLAGVAIAIAVGASTGAGMGWIILHTFIVAASLQSGYPVGRRLASWLHFVRRESANSGEPLPPSSPRQLMRAYCRGRTKGFSAHS